METLKRELGFWDVFSLSSGAMISSGIFVLPAIVYEKAGPSMLFSYFLASLLIIPAMFAQTELATAMPKSGGTYFYITRSFGGMYGTFSGIANWFSLMLKSAFALVGIGVFLKPLVPVYSPHMITILACIFTIIFSILNILSVKGSGRSQI
ncbi:MAG: amino acid permease, partial [Spirochaetales bacterium]|nr:amino acid permease [Spirochaetales bacterium]